MEKEDQGLEPQKRGLDSRSYYPKLKIEKWFDGITLAADTAWETSQDMIGGPGTGDWAREAVDEG